jgi:uncharacterized membrane protein YdfJ with MMPL/SSD domain
MNDGAALHNISWVPASCSDASPSGTGSRLSSRRRRWQLLFRWNVNNPLLIAATAVVGLIAFPLLQPTWVMVK